ncbi:hypothetical protein TSH64_07485 [Azospirillum sp. TSH64]|nr:hypothetical protein TSH64_07485 [Azospirillum sp. TSH64]
MPAHHTLLAVPVEQRQGAGVGIRNTVDGIVFHPDDRQGVLIMVWNHQIKIGKLRWNDGDQTTCQSIEQPL